MVIKTSWIEKYSKESVNFSVKNLKNWRWNSKKAEKIAGNIPQLKIYREKNLDTKNVLSKFLSSKNCPEKNPEALKMTVKN